MSIRLDRAIFALDTLKPVVKAVPIAGQYLESITDLLGLACTHAKDVKANKEDIGALAERVIRYVTVIVEKAQQMPEADISIRMIAIRDFKDLMEELVQKTNHQAKRSIVSRLVRKGKDKEDITNLSKRLDQVIIKFGMEAQLNSMYGLEDVVNRIKQLHIGQEQAKEAHVKIQQNLLLDKLHPVATARHDHEHAPRGCIKGTRVAVIERIVQWIMDMTTLETIFWLSGLAGTGKTAIMKTLSERLVQLGVLGGCFFISINSADRRDPQNIVRTLVYQLARFQPVLCEPICNVLRNNPDVVNQAMTSQIPILLLDPFIQVLDRIGTPIVLLIDAMDECDKFNDVEGGSFLSTLLSVIHQHPAKLKLVVASRLSPAIWRVFNTVAAERFQLHEIEKEVVDADIKLYLEVEFEETTRSRGLEHAPRWYTSEDLIQLVIWAGSLFIYAFTIIKWVNNPRFMPKDRLRQILGWRQHDKSRSPFQAIDELYSSILQNSLGSDSNDHKEVTRRIHQLLETLIVAFEPLSVPQLAGILGHNEDAVRLDLEQLSAVIPIPERGSAEPLVIYHASFADYLTDEKRCLPESGFYVSVWEAHGQTGIRCLDMDYNHRYGKNNNINTNSSNSFQPGLSYASKRWKEHLRLSSNSEDFVTLAVKKVREVTSQYREDIEALSNLSSLLSVQSERTSEVDVVSEKIAVDRLLVKLAESSHSFEHMRLSDIASGLWWLHSRNGDEQLLHEAIRLDREALKLRPPGHPLRHSSLDELGTRLWTLYKHNGNEQLLHEAIRLDREALKLRPPGHPLRHSSLDELGTRLWTLYKHNGNEQLLYEAISMGREALELCPPGHYFRSFILSHFSTGLLSLYERNGHEPLLYEVIGMEREALELRPPRHPFRDWSLNNLSVALWSLYEHTCDEQLRDEAISLHTEALKLHPPIDRIRVWRLNSLAGDLWSVCEKDRDE